MSRLLKVGAMVLTSWVLVATSQPRPPCTTNTPQQVRFTATSSCGGDAGVVVLQSDSACKLGVLGGDAVGLPSKGEQSGPGSLFDVSLTLEGEPDGGLLADGGEPEFVFCHGRGVDGGAVEFTCHATETCDVVLTP